MLSLKVIYENGIVTVEKPPQSDKPLRVIVTFLEEEAVESDEEQPLLLENFSFMKTRERLRKYNFSLSDATLTLKKCIYSVLT